MKVGCFFCLCSNNLLVKDKRAISLCAYLARSGPISVASLAGNCVLPSLIKINEIDHVDYKTLGKYLDPKYKET